MRVLVTGGREVERADVFAQLDAINILTPIEVIIEGGDAGAPALAASWARVRGVSSWRVPADEARFGGDAFAVRDERIFCMCAPNVVLTFPGGPPIEGLARRSGATVRVPPSPGENPNQVKLFE